MKENVKYLRNFEISFFEMEISKLINYLTNMC